MVDMLLSMKRPAVTGSIFAALCVLAAAVVIGLVGVARAAPTSPNILLIVTDDQTINTLNVMPRTRRRFRLEGTQFKNAIDTTPLCCPSRASILSGRYSHNTGVKTNADAPLFNQDDSLQRYLQDTGYKTAIFGKFLNDWNLDVSPTHWDSWAIWDNGPHYSFSTSTPTVCEPEAGEVCMNENGVKKPRPSGVYETSVVASEASTFIDSTEGNDNQPWFMYLVPTTPHSPFTPETKYASAPIPSFTASPNYFEADRSDKPPYVQADSEDPATVQADRAAQLRMLMSADDMVEQVFQKLDAANETRDTLAIFMSDNSYLWGEHGLEAKPYPYTYGVKVPMLMRWPGHVAAKTVDPRFAANVDIAPTAMQIANATPPTPMDGRSLLQPSTRTRWLAERVGRNGGPPLWAQTRTNSVEYTEYYDDVTGQITFREYYDLNSDPWELTNLLGDGNPSNDPSPAEISGLSAQLASDRACTGVTCP
jgi:arylsulfatase A-like enzyme